MVLLARRHLHHLLLVSLIAIAPACGEDASSLSSGASSSSSSSGTSSGGTGGEDGSTGASSGSTSSGAPAPTDGGVSGPGTSTGSNRPGCKHQAHKTGLTPLQSATGLSFHVYAPATYDKAKGHTVVVLLHGQDSTGVPELTALWQPIADLEELVLVAPKGSRPATNGDANAGNWATADLQKVLGLMTEVDDCYNVFTKKHILWGFSAGTFYGYLLGIAAADRFSGLAMGGANTSFARQNGYAPSSAPWKIPVSHVHGKQDFNAIALTYQDRTDFQAAGHVFTLHEHPGGHSITPAQVKMQYDDLKASVAP